MRRHGKRRYKVLGQNDNGELGDSTKQERSIPVNVLGLTGVPEILVAGYAHTCAMMRDTSMKCWGDNYYGQLGDFSNFDRTYPVLVQGGELKNVVAVSTQFNHSCAVLQSGALKCWGRNAEGQLGDGTKSNKNSPTNVYQLTSGIKAAAAGYEHTCALFDNGSMKCWGNNGYGQLGDGTEIDRIIPGESETLATGVVAIASGGSHSCAMMSYGWVKCWGSNWYGQLGDGSTSSSKFPVDVLEEKPEKR